MKIYLAGPDVFRPDVAVWAVSARELCHRYGFEPLLPIDHHETRPERIVQANLELIRKAQVVAANLNPFRGAEPDSGTAFELGYALALGKKLCGYVSRLDTVSQRVRHHGMHGAGERSGVEQPLDRDGFHIEDFGLPCNVMLAMSARIVEGDLEACLKAIRPRATGV